MSDRPTPETDAELSLYLRHGEAHQVPVTWIEFARKLERERDEAREQATEQFIAAGKAREQAARWLARLQEEGLEEYGN